MREPEVFKMSKLTSVLCFFLVYEHGEHGEYGVWF